MKEYPPEPAGYFSDADYRDCFREWHGILRERRPGLFRLLGIGPDAPFEDFRKLYDERETAALMQLVDDISMFESLMTGKTAASSWLQ